MKYIVQKFKKVSEYLKKYLNIFRHRYDSLRNHHLIDVRKHLILINTPKILFTNHQIPPFYFMKIQLSYLAWWLPGYAYNTAQFFLSEASCIIISIDRREDMNFVYQILMKFSLSFQWIYMSLSALYKKNTYLHSFDFEFYLVDKIF